MIVQQQCSKVHNFTIHADCMRMTNIGSRQSQHDTRSLTNTYTYMIAPRHAGDFHCLNYTKSQAVLKLIIYRLYLLLKQF